MKMPFFLVITSHSINSQLPQFLSLRHIIARLTRLRRLHALIRFSRIRLLYIPLPRKVSLRWYSEDTIEDINREMIEE